MIMSVFESRLKTAVTVIVALAFSGGAAAQVTSGHAAPSTFRIAGTVVAKPGGNALALTRVILRNTKDPKDVQSYLTGDDGRFEFRVPAGKYSLHGARRGFVSSDYNQHEQYSSAIVTGAGIDTENLRLQLLPWAALSGRVLDESGDPVRHADVILWREDHATGVSRTAQYERDTTDDQGAYEFTPLDAGTYFLSVSATPWYAVHPVTSAPEGVSVAPAVVDRGLDVVYPTTFYAGATESDDATPMLIRGGDRLEIDVRLTPVPSLHIIFREQADAGNGYPSPLLQKRVFDQLEMSRGGEAVQPISAGVFEIATAPGKYAVRLASPTQASRISEVDISQDGQEVDTSSGEALSNIVGTVHIVGEEGLPREVFVVLREKQHVVAYGRVNSTGEVELKNVAAGNYEVLAGSQNVSYAVVKVATEGQMGSGHTLKVAPGTSLAVTLTLASGSGRVEGFAKLGGKGVAGAMVVLVPNHPEANIELFRRDQSDLDGSFVLQGVIPGTYTVIAIADGWDLDWSRAGVLTKYAGHGQTVMVPGSGSHAVQLTEAVEVQGK